MTTQCLEILKPLGSGGKLASPVASRRSSLDHLDLVRQTLDAPKEDTVNLRRLRWPRITPIRTGPSEARVRSFAAAAGKVSLSGFVVVVAEAGLPCCQRSFGSS